MNKRTRKRFIGTVIFGGSILLTAILVLYFSTRQYMDARYPLKFSELIEENARENVLPLSLVYAVVHTESVFDPQAVSDVDARGLMQITRDTFDWIQFKMRPDPLLSYEKACFDPEISVRYGTYLIRVLYDEFGDYDLALCAYHAGRGNVNKWLRDPEISTDGVRVDKIPFSDTNWYVKRVNETRAIYQRLYDLE